MNKELLDLPYSSAKRSILTLASATFNITITQDQYVIKFWHVTAACRLLAGEK